MKKIALLLLLLFAKNSFSQSINDYKAVVIPIKFDLQKSPNQYRLQTFSKINFQKAGFDAFYTNDPILLDYTNKCSLLYFDIQADNGFLSTKLYLVLKDCYEKVVYKSAVGISRSKDYEIAYPEALNNAFESLYAQKYAFNGNNNFTLNASKNDVTSNAIGSNGTQISPLNSAVVAVPLKVNTAVDTSTISGKMLSAQPTTYGYQLMDSEPKVIMKLYRTSSQKVFLAIRGTLQGIVLSNDSQWFFEYYQGESLISEKFDCKL